MDMASKLFTFTFTCTCAPHASNVNAKSVIYTCRINYIIGLQPIAPRKETSNCVPDSLRNQNRRTACRVAGMRLRSYVQTCTESLFCNYTCTKSDTSITRMCTC